MLNLIYGIESFNTYFYYVTHYFLLLLFHLTYLQLYILNAEDCSPITSNEETKMIFLFPKSPTSNHHDPHLMVLTLLCDSLPLSMGEICTCFYPVEYGKGCGLYATMCTITLPVTVMSVLREDVPFWL